jgi:CRISPR-associated protein Cas5d
MISVFLEGPLACFTRPEFKAERVSYEVLTPSAARGILEAIFWKPGLRWMVRTILVLAPIRFMAVSRRELASKSAVPRADLDGVFPDPEDLVRAMPRQQRSALLLRDVAYVVDAEIEVTSGNPTMAAQYHARTMDRLRKGRCYRQPYFGCREFVADFRRAEGADRKPIPLNLDLGWMSQGLAWAGDRVVPSFFPAHLVGGILSVQPVSGLKAASTP